MTFYITSSDITSTVLLDFDLSVYIDKTNTHIEYLAQTYGLTSADIVTPIHSVIKEYAIAYCSRMVVLDKIGANNLEATTNDKYIVLYQIQNDEVERLRKYISSSLIQQTATDPSQFSPTCTIFRG